MCIPHIYVRTKRVNNSKPQRRIWQKSIFKSHLWYCKWIIDNFNLRPFKAKFLTIVVHGESNWNRSTIRSFNACNFSRNCGTLMASDARTINQLTQRIRAQMGRFHTQNKAYGIHDVWFSYGAWIREVQREWWNGKPTLKHKTKKRRKMRAIRNPRKRQNRHWNKKKFVFNRRNKYKKYT